VVSLSGSYTLAHGCSTGVAGSAGERLEPHIEPLEPGQRALPRAAWSLSCLLHVWTGIGFEFRWGCTRAGLRVCLPVCN